MNQLQVGQKLTLTYEGRDFEVIVIDPDGLGEGQPSVGFGFRMAERYAGVSESTLRTWVRGSDDEKYLELPSGKALRVRDILAIDGNSYSVVEASDWFAIAVDLLVNPGRTAKSLRSRLGDFIGWFAVKGFYAEAFVAFKGVYTAKDSRATTQWLESRSLGVPTRNFYTDLLQAQGCKNYDYAQWTDYVYRGLFGMSAKEMRETWDLVSGNPNIARNYIPKAEALDAVRFCEDMVVRVFVDDLQDAHETAVSLTKRKFIGGS